MLAGEKPAAAHRHTEPKNKTTEDDDTQEELPYRTENDAVGGHAAGRDIALHDLFIALWSWNNPAGFIGYIGIDPSALKIPGAWILATAAAVGYIVCTARMIPTVRRNLFRFNGALKWIAIYAAFTGGIVEETVFRRMLMEWLADNGTNTLWQIGISGLAFGLVHISWGLLGGISRIGAGSALATTVLGLLLALVYVVAARNVLPAIAAHTLINLFVEPWLIVHAIGSAQGRKEPQEEADYPAP